MRITPINHTKFTGYKLQDVNKFTKYISEKKSGSCYDLNKKFSSELISDSIMAGSLKVDMALQNWKVGQNLTSQAPIQSSNSIAQQIKEIKR